MIIESFDYDTHIREVTRWGSKHKFPLPAKDFLPEIGLIVNQAAAGFLYLSDSKLAWIEWVFSNPDKGEEERKDALDMLMKALEQLAIVKGMKVLFSAAGSEAYRKVLERNKFNMTDENMSHHVKGIG